MFVRKYFENTYCWSHFQLSKHFQHAKRKNIYLVQIFIVQVLQGWLVTIHLRFCHRHQQKNTLLWLLITLSSFNYKNISSLQRGKKYLSQSIYCISSTSLSSYNSFRYMYIGTSKEYCVLIFKTNQVQYW